MGYALFAQRKILLTDRVNNLNLQLVELSNKKAKLEQLGSAVADGEISAMDLAQCQEAGLALSYEIGKDGKLALAKTSKEYQVGRAMLESENDKQYGGSKIGNGICGAGAGAATGAVIGTAIGGWAFGLGTAIGAGIGALVGGFVADKASEKTQAKNEEIEAYNKAFDETQIKNIIEDITRDIAQMENRIDKQQANTETRLTAAQTELDKVKEQEGRAIESSTPQYGGVA
jgi:outer membrane lipoprotein SlyB